MASTEGHSGYSSYSPISTLDRQYAEPVGKRMFLFIRTNPNVYLAGGVEAILKSSSHPTPKLSTATATEVEGTYPDQPESSTTNDAPSSDPFAFLGEDQGDAESTDDSKKKGRNFGRFLKSVAKTANSQIRQGMTQLAIKADVSSFHFLFRPSKNKPLSVF
jgi:hypothetical protein